MRSRTAGQASGPREISAGDGQGIRFSLTWRARAADVTTEKWGTGMPSPARRASVAALVPTDRRGAARLSGPPSTYEGAAPSGTEPPPPATRLHRTCPPAQPTHDAGLTLEGRIGCRRSRSGERFARMA